MGFYRRLRGVCKIMERQLSTIQKVVDMQEIPGADNIVYIRILGWNLIARKNEFNIGDMAVFFEIDSILPETEWSEFLRPKKFHIKTMKLGKFGVISQGLALPVSILDPEISVVEGIDVTEALGVTKYEPPVKDRGLDLRGRKVNPFPLNVPKTDETRIQSMPHLFDLFKKHAWIGTLKLDGASFTTGYQVDGRFIVASRNYTLCDDGNHWYELAKTLNLSEKLIEYPGYFIQGEMVGPGVQGNKLNLKERDLYVFNVYYAPEGRYLTPFEAILFVDTLGMKHVPITSVAEGFPEDGNIDELVRQVSTVNYSEYFETSDFPAEGYVFRLQELQDGMFVRPSFKVINVNYLLKVGE